MNTKFNIFINRNTTILFALIGCALSAVMFGVEKSQAAQVKIPLPNFVANFNGSTNALLDGHAIKPILSREVQYRSGVRGQGIYIHYNGSGRRPMLLYPTDNLFRSSSGTIMFWFRPNWDGKTVNSRNKRPFHYLISGFKGNVQKMNGAQRRENRRLWFFMGSWLRCDLFSQNKHNKPVKVRKPVRGSWQAGEWQHMAVTWSPDGAKLYLNGLLYQQGKVPARGIASGKASLSQITDLVIGGASHTADGTFDELKIFKSALTRKQIEFIYYSTVPVDIVVGQRFITAGSKHTLAIDLYKAGKGQLPAASKPIVDISADATIAFKLTNASGKVLSKTDQISLKKHAPGNVNFHVPALKSGDYKLSWKGQSEGAQWTGAVVLHTYNQQSAAPISTKPAKLGKTIDYVDCTKTTHGYIDSGSAHVVKVNGQPAYREAGPNPKDRFSYVLDFPHADGSPVVIEITWPDNKPRSMGFYMYRPNQYEKRRTLRDRLSGGVQSGGKFRASGKMKTVSYIFYPWYHKYLFEARTKISGYPAAVASIKVRPILGRLPKLKINRPEGLPQRHFGDIDEDQSFSLRLVDPAAFRHNETGSYAVKVMQELLDYMDYTGQDTLAYPFERYDYTLSPYAGQYGASRLEVMGWQSLMLNMFARRGKHLWAVANIYTPVAIAHSPKKWKKWAGQGVLLTNLKGEIIGGSRPIINPANPKARSIYLEQIRRMVKRFGHHPAFTGIDLWMNRGHSPLLFPSLEVGYDDFTVHAFEQDTNLHVGVDIHDPNRMNKRYKILTGPMRKAWLKWRAKQVTDFIHQIASTVHKIVPRMPVRATFVNMLGIGEQKPSQQLHNPASLIQQMYIQCGFDITALNNIPGVTAAPSLRLTRGRWKMHRSNGSFNDISQIFRNLTSYSEFRNSPKSAIELFLVYFESFNGSLKPNQFPSYFQSAGVKPFGKYFLGMLTRYMAAVDADTLLIGGQSLGTWGRSKQARTFARAYLALPAGQYKDITGSGDPVIARILHTSKGDYCYLVNLINSPLKVTLSSDSGTDSWIDLATGKKVSSQITLKPYALVALKGGVTPDSITVDIPDETLVRYQNELNNLITEVNSIAHLGGAVSKKRAMLKKIIKAIQSHSLYKAHTLIFSKTMNELRSLSKVAQKGYLKKQASMIKQGHYAVDCGASKFYVAKNGTLFFPDQPYEPGPGGYGYIGNHRLTAGRSIAGLKETKNPKLFATESYNFKGYRFTVPDGCYRVKVYLRVGYPPSQKPGIFVFNLHAEGKLVAKNYDVFIHQGSDPKHVAILTIPRVCVKDGVLNLTYSLPKGSGPSVRFANAITVKPIQSHK